MQTINTLSRRKMVMIRLKAVMHQMSVMLKPMLMKIDLVSSLETRELSKAGMQHPISHLLSAGQAGDPHPSAENIDFHRAVFIFN